MNKDYYKTWEAEGYFKPSGKGEAYSITLPPPNVTGTLHMGHGLQVTLMDTLIRYHRMLGKNVLWQAGTDHAGIATQMVVERKLAKENITRENLGREKFVEKIWEWKHESENTIKNQLRRMGASLDWSREKFTMDHSICDAVHKVFIQLFDEGLIYRGKKLVNWDPILHTALSDLEVVNEEKQGELWYIRYPLVDSQEHLIVATTRPETMLGDTAVAVNPDDERYQHLIGKYITLPLCDRNIPIIADDYVDENFGTGVVKITPAHDFNDNEVGKHHGLPVINVFTKDACINNNAPKAYQGLDRFEARKKIIDELNAQGFLEKTEPHKLTIPKGDRSGAIIEPYLTDQWFMKMKPLAAPAIKAVKDGDIEFIPANWSKTYFQWLENIEDWCISRQLWWGHRIPAWYDEDENIYVGENEKDVRKKYNIESNVALHQDKDVLDTWFSSALWPFATLGWPKKTEELKTFYPNSVLVTGFDIIFFWVARMVMQGLKFTGQIPFKQVYIHGLIRDHNGQKMSKSKGNIIDPLDIVDGIDLETLVEKRTSTLMQPHLAKKIEKATRKEFPEGIPAFGVDALRFTYCALASTGRDIRFDLGRVEGYRNFCNKIRNAARYVSMNVEENIDLKQKAELNLPDRWILAKLQQTIESTHKHFSTYRFDLLAQGIYEFIWNEYCDWYLELSKPILTSDKFSTKQKHGTQQTLLNVLETNLKLLHPIMPFITEELWQYDDTIVLQPYPKTDEKLIDETALNEVEWLKEMITAIRNIRGEMNISPKKPIPLLLNKGDKKDKQHIEANKLVLTTLAKIESINWLDSTPPTAATAVVGNLELLIPMEGLIDLNAERNRLEKEIQKLKKELERSSGKLNNPNFTDKAPEAVIIKERERAKSAEAAITKLQQQLDNISTC